MYLCSENMIVMRKEYIKPEVEFITFSTSSIIAASPDMETGGEQTGEGEGSDFTEDAGAVRGDWDNIWKNM